MSEAIIQTIISIAREGPQIVLYVSFLGLLWWCARQMGRITSAIDANTIALLSNQNLLIAHDLTTIGVEKGIGEEPCRQALLKYEEVRKQNDRLIEILAERSSPRRAG